MKVKVMTEFIDKHTNKIHKVSEVMDITKERLAEIRKVDRNLVKEVKETSVNKETKE